MPGPLRPGMAYDATRSAPERTATDDRSADTALAALSYVFGFVSGMATFHLTDDGFARFHAAQSIVLWCLSLAGFGVIAVVTLVAGAVTAIPVVGGTLWTLVGAVLGLCRLALLCGLVGGVLTGAVGAARGTRTRVPVVAPLADRVVSAARV